MDTWGLTTCSVNLPCQPLPHTCAEVDASLHCRAHSHHPKHGLLGWPRLHGALQWLSYPSACNISCGSLGDLCGKKGASRTIAIKDRGEQSIQIHLQISSGASWAVEYWVGGDLRRAASVSHTPEQELFSLIKFDIQLSNL